MSQLQTLAVFFSVAEERSFSAAAKKMGLSQPTVSFHIDNLEKKMGCPLFVRTRRGAELNVYGKTLYENTIQVQELLARSERRIRELSNGLAGQVNIGAGTVPGEYILPPLLAGFLSQYPGLTVHLASDDSREIFRQYRDGKFAICILGFAPDVADEVRCLWTDEVVLVRGASSGSALSEKGTPNAIKIEQLSELPMVVRREGSASRTSVENAIQKQGLSTSAWRVVMQVTGNEAMKRALMAGAGVGFISRRVVAMELQSGLLSQIQVEGFSVKRHFYAMRNKNHEFPAAVQLWNYLLEHRDCEEES